ncbi:MAG: glycosyltransferase, partial [Rhizobiaceae bacterium]
GLPNAVHYTSGGPWFKNWQDVAYADLWKKEALAIDPDFKPV